jgi:hypothetical protein
MAEIPKKWSKSPLHVPDVPVRRREPFSKRPKAFEKFHVIKMAGDAVDEARRVEAKKGPPLRERAGSGSRIATICQALRKRPLYHLNVKI